ncbi:hypothetical protein, partial [Nitratidesulfovibrio oxamicus]|uniref:hypothetical protein n=1 Tax=Nitratidesulfovibrio oxamicus TaxID=32016 RepID=UPI001E34697A
MTVPFGLDAAAFVPGEAAPEGDAALAGDGGPVAGLRGPWEHPALRGPWEHPALRAVAGATL